MGQVPLPGSLWPGEALADGGGRGLGAGRHAELDEDVRDVMLGGLAADVERGRDLRVGETRSNEFEHVDLAGGELVGRRYRLPQAPHVGDRSQALEARTRGCTLAPRGVPVVEGAVGLAEQEPGPGYLVRHVQLMPQVER